MQVVGGISQPRHLFVARSRSAPTSGETGAAIVSERLEGCTVSTVL
jgi:hypothetical protein